MESAIISKSRLLLTAAIAAGTCTLSKAYKIAKLSSVLDELHLMSYDLSGSWETKKLDTILQLIALMTLV